MFTADDIARARKFIKVSMVAMPMARGAARGMEMPAAVAQGLGARPRPSAAFGATTPHFEPPMADPYQFNAPGSFSPDTKSIGWNPPPQPGFWGSLGKATAGTVLKPFDLARSFVGAAPGRSGLMNWLGGSPKMLGGKLFGFQSWQNEAKQHLANDNGIGWAAPYQRAMEQSTSYQKALPQYLERHAPFFLHPMKTLETWGSNNLGSKFPSDVK